MANIGVLGIFLVICQLITTTNAVKCFDCYDTGPSNKNCTEENYCEGAACLIYEAGDDKTSTAFCLLSLEGIQKLQNGCWLEPDGKGKHCLCAGQFCNKLRDRTLVTTYDPFASPIPNMEFLTHNPLIDYDQVDIKTSKESKTVGGDVKDKYKIHIHNKINTIEKISKDLDYPGDDDLVPINFEDYHAHTQDKYDGSGDKNHKNDSSKQKNHNSKQKMHKYDGVKDKNQKDDSKTISIDLEDNEVQKSEERIEDLPQDEGSLITEQDPLVIPMGSDVIAHGSIEAESINSSTYYKIPETLMLLASLFLSLYLF
uniref:Activin_recp domain-containing protein n=1 Tax=Rhabditophanes sp. KR3021 TaxID=114890 RepID=A0AC35UHF4_9BILA